MSAAFFFTRYTFEGLIKVPAVTLYFEIWGCRDSSNIMAATNVRVQVFQHAYLDPFPHMQALTVVWFHLCTSAFLLLHPPEPRPPTKVSSFPKRTMASPSLRPLKGFKKRSRNDAYSFVGNNQNRALLRSLFGCLGFSEGILKSASITIQSALHYGRRLTGAWDPMKNPMYRSSVCTHTPGAVA